MFHVRTCVTRAKCGCKGTTFFGYSKTFGHKTSVWAQKKLRDNHLQRSFSHLSDGTNYNYNHLILLSFKCKVTYIFNNAWHKFYANT